MGKRISTVNASRIRFGVILGKLNAEIGLTAKDQAYILAEAGVKVNSLVARAMWRAYDAELIRQYMSGELTTFQYLDKYDKEVFTDA